jgi:asparagine synthase (glutamine-hydrolysing)
LCGITGFTHSHRTPDPAQIEKATATLLHRGPDQQGVFRSSAVSLGATRLKILDLAGGDQPIVSTDNRAVIVFNGEIYNHLELRSELESLGHCFTSHCDTETVLRAFLQWDTACFARLRGMFAAAIWSISEPRLILARDRLGIKPLYIARKGSDLYFGSELKALFAHPEIERHLSLEGLDCYLSLNYLPCPWTLVQGIEKLPPGHWLEWKAGAVRSEPYWKLPLAHPRRISLADAQHKLDSLLRESVREHLLSDVPLGLWLSGGVDSSTILHYAAQASSSPLKTFSISFRGRSFDETPYVHECVRRYGTDHAEMDLNPESDLRGAIEEFAWFSDEPSADAGALPVWFLSKLSKTRTTVALSGEGADELFGGYLTYRANRLAAPSRFIPRSARRLALAALNGWPVSDEKISLEYKLKRFLEGSLMPPARAHVHWNGTFTDDVKQALVRIPLPSALARILAQLDDARRSAPSAGSLAAFLWFDQSYFLADDILIKSDRMSMAHSVEVRPPFLDHRIVEFAASLPSHLKVSGSRQKILLKQLMRDKLPPMILSRKKAGFDIPAHEWLRGPLRRLLEETIEAGLAAHSDLFRSEAVREVLSAHLQRRANLGYHLWGLLVLFLWMKKWEIQSPAPGRERLLPRTAATFISPSS